MWKFERSASQSQLRRKISFTFFIDTTSTTSLYKLLSDGRRWSRREFWPQAQPHRKRIPAPNWTPSHILHTARHTCSGKRLTTHLEASAVCQLASRRLPATSSPALAHLSLVLTHQVSQLLVPNPPVSTLDPHGNAVIQLQSGNVP